MPVKQYEKINPVQKAQQKIKQDNSISIPNWAPFAIVIFTALLYSQALFNGLTSNDDDFYILNNPFIRDFSLHGIKAIFTSFYASNYHPFTTFTWLLIYKWFGTAPLPYHLLNVCLHLINTYLVFLLVKRLSHKDITALVVMFLFAVHPMHVESVAWASELKDVLYSLFYLLSMLFYLRYISHFKAKYYTAVLLLFLASLLSKSAAVTLPVLLIVIDLYKGRKINAKLFIEKIPFLFFSLLFGILAIFSQQASGAITNLIISYSPINSFFLFTSGLAFYFIWLIAPFSLSIFHYFPNLQEGLLPWPYYASLPVILLIAWGVARNAYRKEVLFGISFFFVTISVMLQVISVGSALTSERYTYISYIGLFYTAGWLISNTIEKTQYKRIIIGLFSLFITVYSVQTWNRITVWKDDRSLYSDLVNKNPRFYFGYYLMGDVEKKEGHILEALNDYTKAIELNPEHEDSHYNRGVINDEIGNTKLAIQDYCNAIRLNPKQPDSYNNRGWDYFQLGNINSAMQDYNKAIQLNPSYAEAYNNRAWVYDQSGDAASAIKDYTKAIQLKPNFTKPLYNRAVLKEKTGDLKGAIEDYTLLLKLNPGDNTIYFSIGNIYQGLNDIDSACVNWQKAKQLGNKNAIEMIKHYCH